MSHVGAHTSSQTVHTDVDDRVTFRLDPDAEPGDVLPVLARLLIEICRDDKPEEKLSDHI